MSNTFLFGTWKIEGLCSGWKSSVSWNSSGRRARALASGHLETIGRRRRKYDKYGGLNRKEHKNYQILNFYIRPLVKQQRVHLRIGRPEVRISGRSIGYSVVMARHGHKISSKEAVLHGCNDAEIARKTRYTL